MRYLKILVLLLVSSCSKSRSKILELQAALHDTCPDKIIISCLRCRCVEDELNLICKTNKEILSKYKIYCDTTCKGSLNTKIPVHHINQKLLDSLMPDFYNLMLINKANSEGRMIETENMESLDKHL